MKIGKVARIGSDCTESIYKYKLDSFIRDSFILDAVSREDVLYLLPLIRKTHHVNLLKPAFDIPPYLLNINKIAIRPIVKIPQLPSLYQRLPCPFPITLIVDDEVYPSS